MGVTVGELRRVRDPGGVLGASTGPGSVQRGDGEVGCVSAVLGWEGKGRRKEASSMPGSMRGL
jgi:hypothetical protein